MVKYYTFIKRNILEEESCVSILELDQYFAGNTYMYFETRHISTSKVVDSSVALCEAVQMP